MSVSLSASPVSIKSGKSGQLTINIATSGTPACAALQCSLSYPTGWPVPVLAPGASATQAGKSLSSNTANPMTVVVAGLNVNPIPDGAVIVAQISVPKKTPRGTVTLNIANVIASDPTGTISIPATGGTAQVTVLSPFDLNGDTLVDGSDASLVIRQILALDPPNPDADFDGDGAVTVLDYMLLEVNGIIGGE